MITNNCKQCGEEIKTYKSVNKKFCNPTCYGRYESKEFLDKECEECGSEYSVRPSRDDSKTCSEDCRVKYTAKRNEKENVEVECGWCGEMNEILPHKKKTFRFCDLECRHNWDSYRMSGEKHFNYKHGETIPYGKNYNKMRNKAMDRDNYSCQYCGTGENLHCHHIVPRMLFFRWDKPMEHSNKLSNLVILCEEHHRAVEGGSIELD